MTATEKLEQLKSCKFLSLKGGRTIILTPEEAQTFEKVFLDSKVDTYKIKGQMFTKYNVEGINTWNYYWDSKLRSANVERLYNDIRAEIEIEETQRITNRE